MMWTWSNLIAGLLILCLSSSPVRDLIDLAIPAQAAIQFCRLSAASAQPTLASISVLRNRSINSMNAIDGTKRIKAVIAAI